MRPRTEIVCANLLSAVVLMTLASLRRPPWIQMGGSLGLVHYGDTPPANVRSRAVDCVSPAALRRPRRITCCSEKVRRSRPSGPVDIVLPADTPGDHPAPRGMALDLVHHAAPWHERRQLLQRAGAPECESPRHGPPSAAWLRRLCRLGHRCRQGDVAARAGLRDYRLRLRLPDRKTFYYYPTLSNPFTTVITLAAGRIFDLQRTRQF